MPFTDIKPRSELVTLKELRARQPKDRLPLTQARRQMVQLLHANPNSTTGDLIAVVPNISGGHHAVIKWLVLNGLVYVSGHKLNGNGPQINRYSLTDEGKKYLL